MENTERVLAYHLAKEITSQELNEVAGGRQEISSPTVAQYCLYISGANGQMDFGADANW